MLQLRVFGAPPLMADVAAELRAIDGARQVIRTTDADADGALVTAVLVDDAVDGALKRLDRLGVGAGNMMLVRLDAVGHSAAERPLASVVWSELLSQAGANARPLPRYLMFMVAAAVIAAFGVIYANTTLVVGAMAISPDTLPVTAAATALVLGRWLLAGRALCALTFGLATVCVISAILSVTLNQLGLLRAGFDVGSGGFLDGLSTVNISTPLVALAAGMAAMLALETRASAAVGVAISVTTIPASAYLGVAAGVGEIDKAAGALLVLGINVVMLLVGGYLTLLAQRELGIIHSKARVGELSARRREPGHRDPAAKQQSSRA